jgi:hypothetical protein
VTTARLQLGGCCCSACCCMTARRSRWLAKRRDGGGGPPYAEETAASLERKAYACALLTANTQQAVVRVTGPGGAYSWRLLP